MSEVVKSVSIENLVNQREAAIAAFRRALAALEEASEICQAGHLGVPDIRLERHSRYSNPVADTEALGSIVKEIDSTGWQYLMSESGLRTFMDRKAREEWDAKIAGRDIPELTRENIAATFAGLNGSRGELFERGVIQVFRNLSWDYKTNQPQMFGKRIIMNGVVDQYGYASLSRANEVDDLIRCFHVLDEKPEPDHRQGFYRLLSDARGESGNTMETEYFHLRYFKKGSGHFTFKRPELVDRMNQILAKHHPNALAAPK